MIVFSALVPHSPLLIPSIGKEHRNDLNATLDAYQKMEEQLYLSKPDTIVMISPHAPMYPDAFSGNLAAQFTGTLKEFGDHSTTVQAKADYLLLDHIHRGMRETNLPFTLTSSEELDYGFTVPLLLLSNHLKNWKIVPLSVAALDAQTHYAFGQALFQVLQAESTRIAVIASADLSHHANPHSPEGEKPEGKQFEEAFQQTIQDLQAQRLIDLPESVLTAAGQCGCKPFLILLGIIKALHVKPHILSYEAPFGVGYVTAEFPLA